MGMGGSKTKVVKAEEPVVPAVAQNISEQTNSAVSGQEDARARMRGLRSTYNRFADDADRVNGAAKRLG